MRKRELKNMEWGILITAIILCVIGIVALFSATQETDYEEFTKQIIWFVVSIIAMVVVMFIDYNLLLKASPVLYGIFIVLLIGVLFTSPINGATSWFNIAGFSFQPGEFDKIFVILFLTYTIIKIQRKGQDEINRVTRLLLALAVVGLPVLLIVMQLVVKHLQLRQHIIQDIIIVQVAIRYREQRVKRQRLNLLIIHQDIIIVLIVIILCQVLNVKRRQRKLHHIHQDITIVKILQNIVYLGINV